MNKNYVSREGAETRRKENADILLRASAPSRENPYPKGNQP